jgi:hypothetical protein
MNNRHSYFVFGLCALSLGVSTVVMSEGSPSLRLLSQSQYADSISAIFGASTVPNVRFAPIQRVDGLLSAGARTAGITTGALEPMFRSAEDVALRVVDPEYRDRFIPCRPIDSKKRDDDCARLFLSGVGRLLYRRELQSGETDRILRIAGDAAEESRDFHTGIAAALAYILSSPDFLYIRESYEPDPARPGQWRLDGASRASRLSFFLWNSGPDDLLLRAAARGELYERRGIERQVKRMLASGRIQHGTRAFFSDMLAAEGFDLVAKDPIIYPAFTSRVVSQAREQLLRTLVDHTVVRDLDYRDLFVTRKTFMSRDLAAIYQVPVRAAPDQWVEYEFPEGGARAGVLTLAGFLARYSHPGRTSPTNRGRGLRETLLCQRVPDPPPNVNFSLFEDQEHQFKTARERLDAHATNPVCAACHRLTDPIGLVLEHFDGAGQYRETEDGAFIDTSGKVAGVLVRNANQLGEALKGDPAVSSCVVKRLFSFGAGRKISEADQPLVSRLGTEFADNGYRFKTLLNLIATSDEFFSADSPTQPLPRQEVARVN